MEHTESARVSDLTGSTRPACITAPPRFLQQLVPAHAVSIFVRETDALELSHSSESTLVSNLDEETWLSLTSPAFWAALDDGPSPVSLRGLESQAGAEYQAMPLRAQESVFAGVLCRTGADAGSRDALVQALESPETQDALVHVAESWRRERELDHLRLFHRILDGTLPYGFLAVDELGRVSDFGGRAERILGVTREDALGRDCAIVFRPAGWDGEHPLLGGAGQDASNWELYITHPGGAETPVRLQTLSTQEPRSGAPRVLAVFRDLSEDRSLEEAERQKDRLAVLGELAAGVAHEIRNPLTGIANCAQVLREDLDPDDSHQRFLRIILDEVARLNRIVEGLLNYARPSHPELRESNIEDCIHHAVELLGPDLESKSIGVRTQSRGRIPLIYLDPSQIEQVLLNLIRNAQEAMPDGGELSIECSVIRRLRYRRRTAGRRATDRQRAVEDGPRQRFVQIRVSDTGTGIPPHVIPRIFNPFFTTRSKGTGLGLSLCQSIVQEHGGFLTVRSVAKKGTTFLLDLPVERRQGERRKSRQ